MTEKHWRSQIKIIEVAKLELMESVINAFCKDKFVVGIQYPDAFQDPKSCVAIISYKILED